MKTVTKSYFRPYPTHGLAVIQVMTCSENQHDSPSCNQRLYTYVLHNRSWTTKLANSIRSISNEFNFTALRAPNWTSKTQFEQNRLLHEKRTVNSKQTSTTGNRTFRPLDVSPTHWTFRPRMSMFRPSAFRVFVVVFLYGPHCQS